MRVVTRASRSLLWAPPLHKNAPPGRFCSLTPLPGLAAEKDDDREDFQPPRQHIEDEDDLADWVSGIKISDLKKKLKKAKAPSELTDMLDELEEFF